MTTVSDAILLAGGEGSRLRPLTFHTSKHLLPIYNKPMIFYPLTNLILMGVKRVFLIINPKHESQWNELIKNIDIDIELKIVVQEAPEGIPQAISLCKEYILEKHFYLALGDNLLLGSGMLNRFMDIVHAEPDKAVILAHPVLDVCKYGIAEFDEEGTLAKVVEKPESSLSNLAVVGLYKFGPSALGIVENLMKSERGEYEIADLINEYISQKKCALAHCNVATDFWLDTGTFETLTSASNFVKELSNNGAKDLGNLGQ